MIQEEIEQIQARTETLNNVTGSITTSIGLVDIVVLDETILQPENSTEQTEFILPELSTGGTSFPAQVISTQQSTTLPQGRLDIYYGIILNLNIDIVEKSVQAINLLKVMMSKICVGN